MGYMKYKEYKQYVDYCENDVKTIKQFEQYCLGKWPVPNQNPNLLINLNLRIKKVIFNDPATIILWTDGTKTVVKCSEDDYYDPEKGMAMAVCKKIMGSTFRKTFNEFLPEEKEEDQFAEAINAWLVTMEEFSKDLAKGFKFTIDDK